MPNEQPEVSEAGSQFNMHLQRCASYAGRVIDAQTEYRKLDLLSQSVRALADALAMGGEDLLARLDRIEKAVKA